MTRLRLLLRNLIHFRLANLAVIAGMAVATAVLTGALMVGDSVRQSLRELAVQRLGSVDYVVVGNRFFGEDLAERVQGAAGFAEHFNKVVPAILLRGGAESEQGGRYTGGVQIAAMKDALPGAAPKQLVINALVADELGVEQSARMNLLLPLVSEQPRDSALARRERDQTLARLQGVTVGRVDRDPGFVSLFNLEGSQRTPRNVWVELGQLQEELGQRGRVNMLLLSGTGTDAGRAVSALTAALREKARLADYGLELKKPGVGQTEAVLGSASTYITAPVLEAADAAAQAASTPLRKVSVYLINNVVRLDQQGGDVAKIHYAIAAGMNRLDEQPLADDEVALNEWAARRLGANAGDRIRLDYYLRQSGGDLAEVRSDRAGVGLVLKVARVLPMQGIGADPTLTPEYKGLTDADSVADWDAPEGLEIRKELVSKEDEEYWDKHRAAPKLFVSLATAQKLWGSPYGEVNSLRIPAEKAEAFERELLARIDPQRAGLIVRAVEAEQLAAASAGTDFSVLFIGFSFFIIASAGMLVAMLFRLAIEQRAKQFGLLGALGFTPKMLRRLAIGEGMLLALIGAVIGVAGAIGYTALMMAGLRTWWVSAVGTSALRLHVVPLTLMVGLLGSMLVALLAMSWAAWRVGKAEAAPLLAGAWGNAQRQLRRPGRVLWVTAVVCAIAGLALVAAGVMEWIDPKGAFMGGGGLLLVAGLCQAASSFRSNVRGARTESRSLAVLGMRNARRNRGRSVLTVGLIAFASFVLVAVSAFKQTPPEDPGKKESGTGGFRLMASADLPLLGDPGSAKGRELLGLALNRDEQALWERAAFYPMRSWAGQDMSCLNLTRPTSPTILAVSEPLARRGGFAEDGNPFDALKARPPDGSIPVIADAEAATYILKLKVGQVLEITDQAGKPRNLRLVATLNHSMFQSELLMAESDFRELFPSQSGFGVVLVEASPADAPRLRELMARELRDYAATVEPTTARLERYQEVANTYISTFQTLGSLGLLLGTIGLAVILLRGLVERRAELALLAAIGFTGRRRLALVLSENVMLLLLGLGLGAACALIAVAPAVFGQRRTVNVGQLGLTLGIVLVTGLGVLVLATLAGQRRTSAAALRGD